MYQQRKSWGSWWPQGKGVPESRVPQASWELREDVGDYVE